MAGLVKAQEAQTIGNLLDKTYAPAQRSEAGKATHSRSRSSSRWEPVALVRIILRNTTRRTSILPVGNLQSKQWTETPKQLRSWSHSRITASGKRARTGGAAVSPRRA